MMPTAARPRSAWTIAEWEVFALRCRVARGELADLVLAFPETPGLTPGVLNGFVKSHTRLVKAMIRLEGIIARQHPGVGGGVIRLVHGEEGTAMMGSVRGRVRREAAPLTRPEWSALGDRVKAIRHAVARLGGEVQTTKGGTKPVAMLFFAAAEPGNRALVRLGEIGVPTAPQLGRGHARLLRSAPRVPQPGRRLSASAVNPFGHVAKIAPKPSVG